MSCFVFGKTSINYAYLSEMKKVDFKKEFKDKFDCDKAWSQLQKELRLLNK